MSARTAGYVHVHREYEDEATQGRLSVLACISDKAVR